MRERMPLAATAVRLSMIFRHADGTWVATGRQLSASLLMRQESWIECRAEVWVCANKNVRKVAQTSRYRAVFVASHVHSTSHRWHPLYQASQWHPRVRRRCARLE